MAEFRFYKKVGEVISFKTIKLQFDKSVLEISGNLGDEGEYKLHQFEELQAAKEFFNKNFRQLEQEYKYIPLVESFKVGIPFTSSLTEDEATDYVMPYHDLIITALLKTGNGEIGDGDVIDNIHWFQVDSINRNLAVNTIKLYFNKFKEDNSACFQFL